MVNNRLEMTPEICAIGRLAAWKRVLWRIVLATLESGTCVHKFFEPLVGNGKFMSPSHRDC